MDFRPVASAWDFRPVASAWDFRPRPEIYRLALGFTNSSIFIFGRSLQISNLRPAFWSLFW